ncbi:hypothetical protein L596_027577 [Steinernema carpocapsae]|uniref:DUF19 domain-containing protein n=1 Tax=Steinernema carpocapsae TaxID=34508 RepID=A0A4U5LVW2_STECR|nr:hypothetical protein L596_027577 [Steinernema carpocapsae]
MKRRLPTVLLFILGTSALVRSRSLSITHKCNLESDHTQIGRCLRGYLDLWELVRSYESHATDILFPVPFFNRSTVLFLCDAYLNSRDKCMREGILKRCANDDMITFVQSQMSYFCGEKAPLALEEFTCISRSLRNKTSCHAHVRGIPHNQPGKCSDIPKFLNCVEEDLRASCGDRGVAVVIDAIESFGCSVSEEHAKEAAKVVVKFNITGALTEPTAKAYIQREKSSTIPDELRTFEAVIRQRKRVPRRVASLSLADLPPPVTVANVGVWIDVTSKPLNLQSQTMEVVVNPALADPKSMTEIVRRFFEKKNAASSRRRAPGSRSFTMNEVEKGAFLETDPSVEIAFQEGESEQTSVSVDSSSQGNSAPKGEGEKCDDKKRGQLAQCYAPLIRRWDEIETRHKKSQNILLPIFNFSLAQITELCEVFQVTLEECLTPNLLEACHDNEMIQFVDEQLGNACSHQTDKKFTPSFLCAREVMMNSPKCFEHIHGRNEPAMEKDQKCAGMNSFYNCLQAEIKTTCPSESLTVIKSTIRNLGCSLKETDLSASLESTTPVESNDLTPKSAEKFSEKSTEKITEKTTERITVAPSTKAAGPRNHTRDLEILDGARFSYRLSSECTKPMQTKARQCVAPLMKTWISLREQRPVLLELTFPIYKYTRTELLELCDSYANVFLCAGFEPIMRCLNDELVRFARDHLGYQCSPQNIERFMKHYDCIMELEVMDTGDCRKYVMGLAEPGKDERKCRGVRQYHDCMKPRIVAKCKKGAVEEFEQTVSEFGCEF